MKPFDAIIIATGQAGPSLAARLCGRGQDNRQPGLRKK